MITCMYSCRVCRLEKIKVDVPERHPKENIIDYVKQTATFLGADHIKKSPQCPAQELDIYLPMPKTHDVIGVREQDS